MTERKRPSPEEVDLILRTAARRRRPWTIGVVLLCLLILGAPLALLLWWVWPQPAPTRLLVLTFDELAVPEQTIMLRAQLWPVEPEAEGRLGGHAVFFEDVRPQRPAGQEPWQEKTTSNADGSAAVEWRAPDATGPVDFAARYVGIGQKRGSEDKARIDVWPADARLLIVDVQGTLTDAPAKAWQTGLLRDIRRAPGAADALQAAQAKGYHIVYLALAAERPLTYRKVRDWVQLRPTGAEKRFPDGPVLGRPSYAEGVSEGQARQEILSGLTKRFAGPLIAVARQPQEAETFLAAGLTPFVIREKGLALVGAVQVPAWGELAGRLP